MFLFPFIIAVSLNGLIISAYYQNLCDIRARTEYGWVCGLKRLSETGSIYASFRGVPYARQPVGELRFKELQPPDPWKEDYDAKEEGPNCPQINELFENLQEQPFGMSEACIHVNVHTPIYALPQEDNKKQYMYSEDGDSFKRFSNHSGIYLRNKRSTNDVRQKGLPVLVFVHGGGFYCGSGDADLYGPEYLVSKDVIVVTFNYRVSVFGFLSLNTKSIPGNQGLRDQITLLRWLQRNVRNFGGDPDNVTLMGQSSGAAAVHILSLSDSAKGLFKSVAILSGTAYQAFYTGSRIYAATIAAQFLNILGIISVDPEEIHHILTHIPLRRIIDAVQLLQAQYGIVNFTPVIETIFPGVTTVLDKEPEILIAEGKGNEYPMIIGHTEFEGELFRFKLTYNQYLTRVGANPRNILPLQIGYSSAPNVSFALGKRVKDYCLGHEKSYEALSACYGNSLFVYQAFRLARQRAEMGAAPTFMYQFSYRSELQLFQKALNSHYKGATHIEDITYMFRANSIESPERAFPPKNRDDEMKDWVSSFVVNFMRCNHPTCGKFIWPEATKNHLYYEDIRYPYMNRVLTPTQREQDLIHFYDKLYRDSYVLPVNDTILEDQKE